MNTAVTEYSGSTVRAGKTIRLDDSGDELVQLDILEDQFTLTWSSPLSVTEFLDVLDSKASIDPGAQVTVWRARDETMVEFKVQEIIDRYSGASRDSFWSDCFFVAVTANAIYFSWESQPRIEDEAEAGILNHGPTFVSMTPPWFDQQAVDGFLRATATKIVIDSLDILWQDQLVPSLEKYIDKAGLDLSGGGQGARL